MHGSNASGTKLPSFHQWMLKKEGAAYWKTHYDDMFEAYVSDIFRESQTIYR